MASSSISTSDAPLTQPTDGRRLLKRLALFLSPFVVVAIATGPLLLCTGEFFPASFVAWLQTFSRPFIYLPRFSDHTYQLKISAEKLFKPEVVVLGSSRSNQWRSAMFKPMTFYNGGNAVFTIDDFITTMQSWGDYSPKVVIFTIDYFMFIDAFDKVVQAKSKNDWLSEREILVTLKGLAKGAVADPKILMPDQADPIYGVPALGLNAYLTGTGARIDGSYQYGHAMLNYPQVTVKQAIDWIALGNRWPLLGGDAMTAAHERQFEDFVKMARARNITLVAVTPPFQPDVLTALQMSPHHQAFREFHSTQTAKWLESLGVIYFDFSELASIGGKGDEFVDPYHPSEPAYLRMLLKMLENKSFSQLFPAMDKSKLQIDLSKANRLEVFRNEF